MARVFISYATANRPLADEWRRWLAGEGHEVFLDRDPEAGVVVGEDWEQRLLERLRWADAVVCVVTSAYLASVWCTAEAAIARSRGSRLLPVLAEPGIVHPLLRFSQHADQVTDPAAARAAIGAALRRVDAAGGRGWPDDRSPFPGLRPFEADLHRAFFGRRAETEAVAGLLRSAPEGGRVVLVVGPSGSGKSSLVRAGVRPVLADEPDWWTLPPLLPGSDPVGALARELSAVARQLGLDWTASRVRARLAAGDDGDSDGDGDGDGDGGDQGGGAGLVSLADELLLACPGPRVRRHLLVVVDQFEELLRLAPPDERRRFAGLLRPALAGPVRVVAALRTEFLSQLLSSPELADLPVRISELRPMRPDALAAVVEGPARLAGIELDEGLVSRIVSDTGSGEALPLLAYTLAELADGVGHGGRLSVARYERLGGVGGALVKQADEALADAVAAGGRTDPEVVAGLLRLVAVDEQGRPSRRRVARDELPGPARAELDAFVARRLVSTDAEGGAVVVGVAHERFLGAWPPLAEAITAQASALRARQAVELAAEDWDGAGRPAGQLWERGQLAGAVLDTGARVRPARGRFARAAAGAGSRRRRDGRQRDGRRDGPQPHDRQPHDRQPHDRQPGDRQLGDRQPGDRRPRRWLGRGQELATGAVDISPRARAFLLASIRRDRRRRRRAVTVLSSLLLLSTATSGYAVRQNREAVRQRDLAISRQVAGDAERLRRTDSALAMQLALAAYRLAPNAQSRSSLLNSFATPPVSRLLVHDAPVASLSLRPGGHTVATGSDDSNVRLSDIGGGRPAVRATLIGHVNRVRSVALGLDGRTLASGSDDRTVRLWDVADPRHPAAVLRGHEGAVLSVALGPDAQVLASGSDDRTVRLWDVADPRHPAVVLRGHRGSVLSVAFRPDAQVLATGGEDDTVRLWDLRDPRRGSLAVLPGHADTVTAVTFSPDGRLLASASDDRTVRLWDVGDPQHPRPRAVLLGHQGQVQSVAFSPDGRLLASGSGDRTVRLWDVPTGRAVVSYPQPVGVGQVAFDQDGATLVAGAADGVVRWWAVATPVPIDDPGSMALSADGRVLATGTARSLRIWDVTDTYHPVALAGHVATVTAAAFRPDGRVVATGDADGAVRWWDLADPGRPVPIGRPLRGHFNAITSLAFSSDGRFLASSSEDTTVRLWDVADPRQVTGMVIASYRSVVRYVAFSAVGSTLASSGVDGVRLWEVSASRPAADAGTLSGQPANYTGAISFSPDGRLLATGNGAAVLLSDVSATRRAAGAGPLIVARGGAVVASVAISHDGQLLATGNDDGTIRLWDIADLRRVVEVATLTGPAGTPRSLAFTPGGVLVSSDDDGAVRLWDTDAGRVAQRVCATAGSPITPAEWDQYVPDLPYDPPCA